MRGEFPSTSERSEIRSLRSIVRAQPLGRPVLDDMLAPLAQALELQYASAHRQVPILDGDGWGLAYVSSHPRPYSSTIRSEYGEFIRTSPQATGSYNPLRPERDQRNRVIFLAQVRVTAATERLLYQVFPAMGLAGLDQIRVLLCDDRRLQAWLGGFRPDPFRERDRRILAGIVPALVERLRLEEALFATAVMENGLEAALGLLGAPAFLIDGCARVVVASESGLRLLQSEPRATRERLLASLGGQAHRDVIVPVRQTSGTSWHLVVLRSHDPRLDERLARATRMWKLTPRQSEVLGLVVHGDANKTIADKLDCAAGTIELHVSAILSKAQAASRAALIAMFWR